jgi:hypothetical protein
MNSGLSRLTEEQFRQLQFHCGKPPPAPDPRILTIMWLTPFEKKRKWHTDRIGLAALDPHQEIGSRGVKAL